MSTMSLDLIFKNIKKIVDINEFKICFRSDNHELWNKVYNTLSFKSVIFSENFLDYQKIYNDYFDDQVIDISLIVYNKEDPVALVPAFYFKKKNIISYFDNNLYLPIFKDELDQVSRKNITNNIINFFIKLKKYLKIEKIDLSKHGPEIKKNDLYFDSKNEFQTIDNYHLYLNLQNSLIEIRKNFRKSYLNILNKKIVNKILVFDNKIYDKKIWLNFKNLHFNEAKKQTRSDQSWDKQFDNLCNKKSLFLFYLHNNTMIAGSLYDISSDEAFYSVGVYNQLARQKFISHYIQEAAIREFKLRKIKWYFLGKHLPDKTENISQKEYNISFFKKGFCSNIINNYIIRI